MPRVVRSQAMAGSADVCRAFEACCDPLGSIILGLFLGYMGEVIFSLFRGSEVLGVGAGFSR